MEYCTEGNSSAAEGGKIFERLGGKNGIVRNSKQIDEWHPEAAESGMGTKKMARNLPTGRSNLRRGIGTASG